VRKKLRWLSALRSPVWPTKIVTAKIAVLSLNSSAAADDQCHSPEDPREGLRFLMLAASWPQMIPCTVTV
jgi:hypothetical protein